jgi:hypothetical protein
VGPYRADRAVEAKAISIANTAETAMETCRTGSTTGGYTGCSAAQLRVLDPVLPLDPQLKVASLTASGYTVIVRSVVADSSRTFRIRRNPAGTMTYSYTARGVGSCPASGLWN